MWDVLDVYLDGTQVPVEVPVLTIHVVDYREMCDKAKTNAYPAGLDLVSAYCTLVDEEPADMRPIKKWAREHKVITVRREHMGPTRKATPADS